MAEDNVVNRKVGQRVLQHLGYQIDLAVNGCDVLQRLADQDYDLILMDVQMPEMDGLETTRRIVQQEYRNHASAKHPAGRPYIAAVTASATYEDRHQCLEAGMDDYISKPFTIAALRALLETVYNQRQTAGVLPAEE
jgi:CheY-like chemotaxis protein